MVTVTDAGSSWTNSVYLDVGYDGTGTLAIANGGSVYGGLFGVIGYDAGGFGTVTVDGVGSSFNSDSLYVGYSGTGTVSVTNGGSINVGSGSGTVTLGSTTGSVGTLNIGAKSTDVAAPGGILNAAEVTTGDGAGTLQFNTTATSSSPYYFTKTGLSGGTAVAITGPTQVVNTAGYNVFTGGSTYTGSTTINGGTLADGVANAFSPNSPVSFNLGAGFNVNFNETIAGLNSLTAGSGTANIANGADDQQRQQLCVLRRHLRSRRADEDWSGHGNAGRRKYLYRRHHDQRRHAGRRSRQCVFADQPGVIQFWWRSQRELQRGNRRPRFVDCRQRHRQHR
jgi:T5SS/PEP-CTERM-associated repeat protein/autotransporter-associated beta strand protein